jgi:hypothetical protein
MHYLTDSLWTVGLEIALETFSLGAHLDELSAVSYDLEERDITSEEFFNFLAIKVCVLCVLILEPSVSFSLSY